jgi:peptidoglycan/xylan/chitin deacetylase (PgdA/CDA1 family)
LSQPRSGARGSERIIFNFHGLGTPHADAPDDEKPYWCAPDLFLRLLDEIAAIPARTGLPTEITFDDGNRSDLEIAAPALAERGLTATFFVCAGRLSMPAYLDAAGLRALRDLGMGVGSHGHSHLDLRKADAATLQTEAVGSREALTAALASPIDTFAIPFGSYDRRVLGALRDYRVIYNSDQHRASGEGRVVPRISYVAGWGADTPRSKALERYSALRRHKHRLKGVLKRLR